MRRSGALFDDCDEHVRGHRNPDLRLHRVLARAEEAFDSQMLLDPFEEQLHLPSLAIEGCDQRRVEREIVGQKHHALARVRVSHHDAAQYGGVVGLGVGACEHAGLIAQNARTQLAHPVDGVRVAALEPHVALGAGDEERMRLSDGKQTHEVDVATVEEIERTGLELDQIQRAYIVHLAVADVDETRDIAVQIEQRMQLDGSLLGSKRCPCKHRKAQIDSGRIQRVDSGLQVHAERLLGIHRTRDRNQALREVGIDLPRAHRIGVGKRVSRDQATAKAQVMSRCA